MDSRAEVLKKAYGRLQVELSNKTVEMNSLIEQVGDVRRLAHRHDFLLLPEQTVELISDIQARLDEIVKGSSATLGTEPPEPSNIPGELEWYKGAVEAMKFAVHRFDAMPVEELMPELVRGIKGIVAKAEKGPHDITQTKEEKK